MRYFAPERIPRITPTACARGCSTSSSSVEASALERVASPSNCVAPTCAEWLIRENASRSSSACAEVRLASSINPGRPASDWFAVSINARVRIIMRMAMIASPTSATVTMTMQICAMSGIG